MQSTSFKTKIVILPLVFILAVTLMVSLYYINTLQEYHRANINDFKEEFTTRQYENIKSDVDGIVNFLDYVTTKLGTMPEVEQRVLERINHADMTGAPYTFILKLLKPEGGKDFARILFYNNRAKAVGQLISDDKVDEDNKLFLKEVVSDIQKQGYSYIIYKHAKSDQGQINQKLTLFYLYEPLQWIITSSVFLDEVNETIMKKNQALKGEIRRIVTFSLFSVFFFSLVVLFVFYRISNGVYKVIEKNEMQLLMTNESLEERMREVVESSKRLELIVKGAHLGTWDWNIETGALIVNERWVEMLGYTLDEIKPDLSTWENLVHPEEKEEISRQLTDHLEGRTALFMTEYRLRHKSGKWIWILDVGKVFERDGKGNANHALGIHLDISAQKEAEKQKRKLSSQKEQLKKFESLKTMAQAIAHRFNNSMMVVNGNLDFALKLLPKKTREYEMISAAAIAGKGASQVGSMMLSYVGQQPCEMMDVSLEILVRESISALESQLLPSIILEIVPAEQDIHCSLDELQIKEVIGNVYSNAIESLTDCTGTIEITFGTDFFAVESFPVIFKGENLKDGMFAYCQIKDSGQGISEENLPRVFEPFYTSRFVGRGLGLALTVGYMHSHYGALTVESTLGEGTTVRILFPVST